MRRVVVTGIGVISALGLNTSEFWEALSDGRSGIRPIQSVDCSNLRFRNGAEVSHYNEDMYFEDQQIPFLDRFAQFAIIAARQAVDRAGIKWTSKLRASTAIIMGSCLGGQITEDASFRYLYQHGHKRIHPLAIPRIMANAGASHISMEFGVTGPT